MAEQREIERAGGQRRERGGKEGGGRELGRKHMGQALIDDVMKQ